MLYAIGVGDRIVGTVEYADFPKDALKIRRIGSYTGIQIEQVVALKPDLIVAWKSGNKLADLNKLESLGLNIYYTHPKKMDEISRDLIVLGKKVGAEKKAQQVAEQITKKYDEIKSRYKDKKKVKVFYQLWHEPLRTIGPKSWIESLVNDCNGSNLFHDADAPYPVVSLENVLVKNPEVIVIPHHSGEVGAKKEIWNGWDNIKAVKEKRIFTMNGDILHRFGPRAIQGLEKLCEAIDSAR
ncbi:cobalamin-binding protein [Aliikangiella coralliicola]|uniref:Cobalamin-binding protein n=2 Tax=Aliikangiella coralliicola TaxID=2592383 RepID=A0A545UK91_9GAMM|nr:cobalamin-binding protein [Aliikangiella coralliicola]